MSHYGIAVALFGLVLGAAAFSAQAQTTQSPAAVVRVVDGDTVDLQLEDGRTERVRLIGIDTPRGGRPAEASPVLRPGGLGARS